MESIRTSESPAIPMNSSARFSTSFLVYVTASGNWNEDKITVQHWSTWPLIFHDLSAQMQSLQKYSTILLGDMQKLKPRKIASKTQNVDVTLM